MFHRVIACPPRDPARHVVTPDPERINPGHDQPNSSQPLGILHSTPVRAISGCTVLGGWGVRWTRCGDDMGGVVGTAGWRVVLWAL